MFGNLSLCSAKTEKDIEKDYKILNIRTNIAMNKVDKNALPLFVLKIRNVANHRRVHTLEMPLKL